MKLSARNQLKGKVAEVHKGATTAHVLVDLGHGVTVTSSITNEAVGDLGLKVGDSVAAVIKASDDQQVTVTARLVGDTTVRAVAPSLLSHHPRLTSAKPLPISFEGWRWRGLGD